MKLLTRIALRFPRSTLAVIAAVTLILGFYAYFIRVDSSIVNLLPRDDPDREYHREITSVFGGEEMVIVAVFVDDVFVPAVLDGLASLSDALAAIDGVREVIGPTTVKGVEVSDRGMTTGRLVRNLPLTARDAAELRRKMLYNALYVGNVVSADGRVAGLSVFFDEGVSETRLREIDDEIRLIADRERGGLGDIAVTGIPTLKVGGARLMETDIARFTPLSVFVIACVLTWAFRTVRGVAVALAPVIIAVVWTTGLMVIMGSAINMGTLILNPLLLSIGVAYAIHIVSRYYEEIEDSSSSREAITAAMRHVRLPLLVAALTTICGFATFIPSPIQAIHEFGVDSVLGITAILLICATFIPAVLCLLPTPIRTPARRGESRIIGSALRGVANTAIRHPRSILVSMLAVSLISLSGISQIRVETDYLGFFSERGPMRRENARIARELAGTQPVYIVIEGKVPGAVTRLESLRAIRDIETFALTREKVDRTMSIVGYLAEVRGALTGAAPVLPHDQAELDQLLMLTDLEDVRSLVSPDLTRANIVVRTNLSGSREVRSFAEAIREHAATVLPAGLEAHPTGTLMLLAQSADSLARAQVMGLGQILLTLTVIMAFLFLSFRVALLSLIPNVMPIILLFAFMGWSGIALNVSTSMIAAIAIGLAIDDTIHFLTTFNAELRRSGDQITATLQTMRTVGHPVVFTSVALGLGFFLVTLSNFRPIQDFGVLASATMIMALAADLLLLPALVTTTKIITVWDLLYIKLGKDPHKQIPLFEGLGPFQARVAILMGHLASATRGELLTQLGEMKTELYVLLSGRAEVHRGGRVVRVLGRGDVIGEMGLVRSEPRSADVVAAEDLEYMVLDRQFLRRLKSRYPWIAATVFLNLSKILSERLETTTGHLVDTLARADKGRGPGEELTTWPRNQQR